MPYAIAPERCPRASAGALADYPATVRLLACYRNIEQHEQARQKEAEPSIVGCRG